MTDTDAFKFNNFKIFDSVKDNLPDDAREICDVFEDLLFVWNFKECNLLVVNWRAAQSKNSGDAKFQVRIIIHLICSNHHLRYCHLVDSGAVIDPEFHNLQSVGECRRNFCIVEWAARSFRDGIAAEMGSRRCL